MLTDAASGLHALVPIDDFNSLVSKRLMHCAVVVIIIIDVGIRISFAIQIEGDVEK